MLMHELATVFDYKIVTARVLARIYTQRRDLNEEVNGHKKGCHAGSLQGSLSLTWGSAFKQVTRK